MQMIGNLPWYTYVILFIVVISYIYKYFKQGDEPNLTNPKFKKSLENTLTGDKLFSISLDAVTTEWWGVHINTLNFKKTGNFNNYLEGWGINTTEGYWNLTNYFIEDGRRWYFDFIFNMINSEPEENWASLMDQKFGENERAQRYLNLLKTNTVQDKLKKHGFITFDSELEKGVAAYDSSVLVGQARRAYSAGLITEQEAWKVIDFATKLAKDNFSSWDEFAKSFILGFSLDIRDRKDGYIEEMYHMFSKVKSDSLSPWNTINW